MELTKKQDDYINDERQDEWAKESHESIFDSWKEDNLSNLREWFCEENEQAFNDFCKEEFKEREND